MHSDPSSEILCFGVSLHWAGVSPPGLIGSFGGEYGLWFEGHSQPSSCGPGPPQLLQMRLPASALSGAPSAASRLKPPRSWSQPDFERDDISVWSRMNAATSIVSCTGL